MKEFSGLCCLYPCLLYENADEHGTWGIHSKGLHCAQYNLNTAFTNIKPSIYAVYIYSLMKNCLAGNLA